MVMKKHIWILTLLVIFSQCKNAKIIEKEPPSDWFHAQRAYPKGELDYPALIEGANYVRSVERNQKLDNPWDFEGPTNVEGRITDVEMFSDDLNTILAGSANGGIFKSHDLGNSWIPIFDDALSLAIGDMDISKSNEDIIYVGTGEANAGGGSIAYDGLGVYKSIDKGENWNHVGLEEVGSIGKVQVDPSNSEVVFVAAMGRLFGNNQERGIYRTKDGGENWDLVLNVSDSTGGIDIAIHPLDTKIVYAAMWERVRTPENRSYGGETSGIYKSMDGGDTWQELTNGLPSNPTQKGRIGLTISQSNPDILFAYYAQQGGNLMGVYRTEDGGSSWDKKSNDIIDDVPYIWWFGKIYINPSDENDVYVCSLNMYRSQNGGDSWSNIFQNVHVDQQALFIHPANPGLQILGNDGGIHISENYGETWVKSRGLPNLQFYSCHISELNPNHFLGGSQDNGTNRTLTGSVDDWERIQGGDGFRVFVDPSDEMIIYASTQRGGFYRSTNMGQSFTQILNGITGTANWNTPTIIDPSEFTRLYYGSNKVFRTDNRGSNWTAVSPDLTNGPHAGNLGFGTVTAIDISPLNENHIAAGTDDGNLWITSNFGENWELVSENLPNRWVTAVAWDGFDENSLFVTYSGFRFDENVGHLYRTSDLGLSWTDLSSNLPDVPFNDVISDRVENAQLYIATDIGVFISEDNGGSWIVLGEVLPLVPITDIHLHQTEKTLAAATYGRSMYSYQFEDPVKTENIKVDLNVKVFPNPVIRQTNIVVENKSTILFKSFTLVNSKGQEVYKYSKSLQENDNIELQINVKPGIYFLKGHDGTDSYQLEKIIVNE